MKSNSVIKLLVATMLTSISFNSLADDVRIVNEAYQKAVGKVSWYNQVDIEPSEVVNRRVQKDQTSLIFIRRQDKDPKELSANISVNDTFQVSLHPNGYTQVYSCAGNNHLSAEITGIKSNDLLSKKINFDLPGGQTYFFYINIDDNNYKPSLVRITPESASKLLKNKKYQSHQVSRVVPNCPTPKVTPPQIAPTPKVTPPPTLAKEVSIELEVLFDTNKHFIKPQFENEVAEVADFMNQYPNTTAIIEGHTDSRAPQSYNQKLSQRRADAVKKMLINKFGIAASRLNSIGYGELKPRAPNDTPANLQRNRRTIVVINEKVRIDQNGNQIFD